MIAIELSPTAPMFTPGLGLEVQVRLSNDGVPADVPNPAALRKLPSWRLSPWTEEAEAHASGRVFDNAQGYAPARGQPERLTLDTGASWHGTVRISSDNVPLPPGEWALSLLLPVNGELQESPRCKVRVSQWSIVAGDAGFGVPTLERYDGDALLIQDAAGSRTLYRMPWQERDSDRTGHGGAAPIPLLTVDAAATDPLVPIRNGTFYGDPARWLLWREGATVRAFGTAGEEHALVLAEPPATLLRPALQKTGDDVLLFALSRDSRRLARVRFPRGTSNAPIVEAEILLPMAVRGGSTAFAPDGSAVVVLSATTPGGTALVLLNAGGAGIPRVVELAGATLIPDAAPALVVHPDGLAVAGALVSTETGIAIAEAQFALDSSGTTEGVMRPLGSSDVPAVGGVLRYGESLCVVLRLADSTLLHVGDDGSLEPTTYEAPPVTPLTLVPSGHGALLLCCDPWLGPFMAEA